MSVGEWFSNHEIILTGVTSDLGRALLEKLLRAFPNVKINAVLRSRNGLNKDDRMKSILSSPGYERLRQEDPSAITRVKGLEGNLLYEDIGLSDDDVSRLKNVAVLFHPAGPDGEVLEFCQRLPNLRAIVSVSSLFKQKGSIMETHQNGKNSDVPLVVLRVPFLGPAYKEPIPGFVQVLKGPTALMIGAGYAYGKSDLPAEVFPIDLVVNTMIVAAWERGLRSRSDEPTVYNALSLGCTWAELIEKGNLANRKFSYPTFGVRGMTSVGFLHWIVVLFMEWMPSAACDAILSVFGAKPRCVAEHEKVRKALGSLEPIASRSWSVERKRIYQLQERLTLQDKDAYPISSEIDLESYALCAAASARKYCVNEDSIKIVKNFKLLFVALFVILVLYYFFK
ncbi:fatty acyl-CoA reductase 1-like [Venturia canescens]|uniref:fatty acyl-CoA reductase 1-like n=1 Tax=Venturia canescens TaxID=32260 RepID=UPI001C9CC5FA|nr:fatty acyl-CoA reductase 1-like [Venturia canescens]